MGAREGGCEHHGVGAPGKAWCQILHRPGAKEPLRGALHHTLVGHEGGALVEDLARAWSGGQPPQHGLPSLHDPKWEQAAGPGAAVRALRRAWGVQCWGGLRRRRAALGRPGKEKFLSVWPPWRPCEGPEGAVRQEFLPGPAGGVCIRTCSSAVSPPLKIHGSWSPDINTSRQPLLNPA